MSVDRKGWYFADRGKQTFSGLEKDSLFNQGEELFEGKLQQYPNATDINVLRLYESDLNKRKLETRVIIQAVGGYNNINRKRKILARKSFGLRIGDIVEYENLNWLVDDWINYERSTDDFSSLQFCNGDLEFKIITETSDGRKDDFGRPIVSKTEQSLSLPCVYKTNKISSFDEAPINLPDNRAHAYVQYNENIKVNDEVTVCGRNYRIYGIDATFKHPKENSGFLILTLEMPGKSM